MRIAADRPTIETHVLEATARLLGLPAAKVFINDFAADVPAPERPFVSLRIGPASAGTQQGTVQFEPGLEVWRFEVQSSADGAYTITVDGDTYTHTAAGQTATQIRDSLLALISSANYVAAAAGAVTIEVTSQVLMRRLLASAGAGIRCCQVRGNVIKVTTRPAELSLQARCVGYYSDTPSASNSGVDMAERLAVGLLDPDDTRAMRDDGIAINRAVPTDTTVVTDGFVESVGALDAVLITNYVHITTLDNVTQVQFQWGT